MFDFSQKYTNLQNITIKIVVVGFDLNKKSSKQSLGFDYLLLLKYACVEAEANSRLKAIEFVQLSTFNFPTFYFLNRFSYGS
jgi:hypothetical protein